MHKFYLLIILTLLCACHLETTSSSADIEEAIKKTIEGETQAYMQKDYEKWASYWNHSKDVLRLDVSDAGFAQQRGWDKSGGKLESFFAENPEPITSAFENTNYLIFHDKNLAWVAFDQTWTSQNGEKSVAKGAVTLVKDEKDWKIISYTAIQYDNEEGNVDTLDRE